LLQAWHDIVIFGCGSLSAAVPAGQTSLNFCLLSFAFISLPAYRQEGSAAVVGGRSMNSLPSQIFNVTCY